MATRRKVYRFRMRPTPTQERALLRQAGARRWVWNWSLRRRQEHYKATGKALPLRVLSAELTALKNQPETAWLKDHDAQALQQVLRDLYLAFDKFFKKQARFPKFKSKKRDTPRFRIPQRVKLQDGKVYIPKIGHVRIRQSQVVTESTRSAIFRREADGHWYVSFVVAFEMPDVPLAVPDAEEVVGIDLGLIDFATFSNDLDSIPAPKFYRKGQKKLRKAQRTLSRRRKGSNRKAKARRKVAKVHRKIANQRSDFLHKLSTEIINDHDGVCIEDLNLKGLARTKRLSKSFSDASMGELRRQLTYKTDWNRKHFVVIDRFFPSSRLCNVCGALNDMLTLSDREWDCVCGTHHKRDKLAACNIRDEGLRMLAAGQVESLNARGADVRLATAGNLC